MDVPNHFEDLFGMASVERQKIIIDTDCGIDDAIALLLALSSKDLAEVLAITCCFGNTSIDNVCSNVMRVLTVCEETTIPIHRGCAGPLIARDPPITVHGSDGLGECAHEFSTGGLKESDIPASLALINLAKKYPKQITLIAIGPLTNLAVAHRIDPSFTENLKSIVIMGGNYKGIGNVTEVAEFNFYTDPESANIVVSEALCSVVLVPWETTMEYGIQWELYKELVEIKTKKGRFFKDVTKLHSELDYEAYIDCDVLAAAVAMYPDCIKSSVNHSLVVEHKGEHTRGLTILQNGSTNNSSHKRKARIITGLYYEILCKLRREMLLNIRC